MTRNTTNATAAFGPTEDLLAILRQPRRPAARTRRGPGARLVMRLGALTLTLGHQHTQAPRPLIAV